MIIILLYMLYLYNVIFILNDSFFLNFTSGLGSPPWTILWGVGVSIWDVKIYIWTCLW